MRLRKRLVTGVLGLLAGATSFEVSSEASGQEPVWRASRPLRISVMPQRVESRRVPSRLEVTDSKSLWQVRADQLRRLRASLELVRADVEYLESRLLSYRVFRFSDAMTAPIARTKLELSAARMAVSETEAEIRRVVRAQ